MVSNVVRAPTCRNYFIGVSIKPLSKNTENHAFGLFKQENPSWSEKVLFLFYEILGWEFGVDIKAVTNTSEDT